MEAIKEFFVPYVVSNIVFGAVLAAAWKRPMWARFFLAISFLLAAGFNATTAINTPEVYLGYGKVALLPPFRNFIYGFFSEHIVIIVMVIAVCQFLISLGLALHKTWTRLACMGGFLFGIGLSSLGVGSAFPATIFMAIAFFLLLRIPEHDFIWKWRQYKAHVTSLVM